LAEKTPGFKSCEDTIEGLNHLFHIDNRLEPIGKAA
jgi:hypothetical protein